MGLFGALGKLAGKALKVVAPAVSQAVSVGKGLVGKIGRRQAKAAIGAVAAGGAGAAAAAVKFARSPGGKAVMIGAGGAALGASAEAIMARRGGGGGGYRRRMNPGNTRAMRRAIRRIESGARLYSKFFAVRHGKIKGAHGVHVKKLSIRRAA